MAKFSVEGPGAGALLDRVSAGAVDGDAGVITYTQWLNEGGLLEADLTVTKLAADRFLVVASDTAHGHALDWLRRAASTGRPPGVATSRSPTSPPTAPSSRSRGRGRARCWPPSPTPTWPRTPTRSGRPARSRSPASACCARGSPTSASSATSSTCPPPARSRCTTRCAPRGAVPVGLSALGSLRMEKGYRDFGHDIDNTDDPVSVGLGFALALDKPGGFVGRDAVLARKAAGPPRRRLLQVRLVDPEPLLFHAEPRAPRRRGGRLRPRRVVRLDPGRRGRPRLRRVRRAGHRGLAGRRSLAGRRRRRRGTTPRCRCGRSTTPRRPACASRAPPPDRGAAASGRPMCREDDLRWPAGPSAAQAGTSSRHPADDRPRGSWRRARRRAHAAPRPRPSADPAGTTARTSAPDTRRDSRTTSGASGCRRRRGPRSRSCTGW